MKYGEIPLDRLPNAHLSPEELEGLLSGLSLGEASLTEARKHAATCTDCGERLRRLAAAQSRIGMVRAPNEVRRGADCPPETTWTLVAAHRLDPTELERLTAHAATCDLCGGFLREAWEDLNAEPSAEELTFVAGLSTATDAGRLDLAQKLAAQATPVRSIPRPLAIRRTWAYALAASLV